MEDEIITSNNPLNQIVVNENTSLLRNTDTTNVEIRNWAANTVIKDLKKIGIGLGFLGLVVTLKTAQRAFTVMISSEEEMNWDKLVETINPAENILEFVVTIPQLGISVLAMDAWKWGSTNIYKILKPAIMDAWKWGLKNIFKSAVTNNDSGYTIIGEEELTAQPESTVKSLFKLASSKLGYWVPNHFMITASSMYSVKNLISFQAYINKIISGLNIASTFIRAEVLGFTSDFLRTAITNFGEISIIRSCQEKISPLLSKLKFLDSAEDMAANSRAKNIMIFSLKIVLYSMAMASATFTDNAVKTALVMYTADKLDEFIPTFFNLKMGAIMIGLICSDTFGNKFCNPIAKDKIKKIWDNIKTSFATYENNSETRNPIPINSSADIESDNGYYGSTDINSINQSFPSINSTTQDTIVPQAFPSSEDLCSLEQHHVSTNNQSKGQVMGA